MSNIKNIPLSEPEMTGSELFNIKKCLDSGWISSNGKFVTEFENRLASYNGCKYAVACINGTAAIHISLILAGISYGDEVIAPTVTFIAPINAIKYTGAEPIFMDCDEYLNIDVEKTRDFLRKECTLKQGKLINKISKKPIKAILPVHIFGHPADMEKISELANEYNLKIIEDATESLGSYYNKGRFKNKKTGTIGFCGCLSFNANKIITTAGGGAILTNNKYIAARAKYLTTQAKDHDTKYIHNSIGYNYRLSSIQAALGISQLKKLSKFIDKKRQNFELYETGLIKVKGLKMIKEPWFARSNYWFYSLIIDKNIYGHSNFELMEILAKNKIQTRPLWYLTHKQKPYKNNQFYKIKKAQFYYNRLLNLPCSTGIKEKDILKIITIIKQNEKKA